MTNVLKDVADWVVKRIAQALPPLKKYTVEKKFPRMRALSAKVSRERDDVC